MDADDRKAPATKGDIEDLRTEMKAGEERLLETMRDMQTEMLKAFYSFATTAEVRFKDTEIADMMLRERLTAVEMRVTQIEKRLNLPPAA
jgi:hypothetical protein